MARRYTLTTYPAADAFRDYLEGTGTMDDVRRAPTFVDTTYYCPGYGDCGAMPCPECVVERRVCGGDAGEAMDKKKGKARDGR